MKAQLFVGNVQGRRVLWPAAFLMDRNGGRLPTEGAGVLPVGIVDIADEVRQQASWSEEPDEKWAVDDQGLRLDQPH